MYLEDYCELTTVVIWMFCVTSLQSVSSLHYGAPQLSVFVMLVKLLSSLETLPPPGLEYKYELTAWLVKNCKNLT